MDWTIHYRTLRYLHLGLAATSGVLFAVRGAAMLARQRWPLHPVPQRLGLIVDTGLLVTATRLLWELRLNPLVTPWVQLKLALLPLYVLLALLTFRYARKRVLRTALFVAALVCYGLLLVVAFTHPSVSVPRGMRF